MQYEPLCLDVQACKTRIQRGVGDNLVGERYIGKRCVGEWCVSESA